MDDENTIRLKECFQKAGKRYGFDTVNAEFLQLKDLKITWQRSYRWADFRISDYLSDAPDEVLYTLADSIFKRILGKDAPFPQQLCDWVTRSDFHKTKRSVYLSRCSNLTGTDEGYSKNLNDSYERLVGAGLVPKDSSLFLSWTRTRSSRKMGNCSVLMRVVSISSALDEDDVPDYVLDYCLYQELCHILIGYDPSGDTHSEQFGLMLRRFPKKAEAEVWLSRQCVYV